MKISKKVLLVSLRSWMKIYEESALGELEEFSEQ